MTICEIMARIVRRTEVYEDSPGKHHPSLGVRNMKRRHRRYGGEEYMNSDSSEVEFEGDDEGDEVILVRATSSGSIPCKYPFKIKENDCGNILTIHHTVREGSQLLRIRIAVCCFNEQGNKLIVIDKRGNIFVFDFVSKRYWRLSVKIPRPSFLRSSLLLKSDFIVGDKLGKLYIVDIDNSCVVAGKQLGDNPIAELTFSSRLQRNTASNALLRFGCGALLMNYQSMESTDRLEFNHVHYALKFASFLPNSEQFFTCFTNDSVHIWSTQTLNTLRILHPIKMRNRRLRLLPEEEKIPEFTLRSPNDSDVDENLALNCPEQDYNNGNIVNYCFTPDGNKLYLSTLDGYLLVLTNSTFELEKLFRLHDFVLIQFELLVVPKERTLIGITAHGQVIMLDLTKPDCKLIVQQSNALTMCLSRDGKLLSVRSKCGELNVWSTCRLYNLLHANSNRLEMLRSLTTPPTTTTTRSSKGKQSLVKSSITGCLSEDLRKLLKRERLNAILLEYGCYPSKYRMLIWSTLLALPCNRSSFQQLLKLSTPSAVQKVMGELQLCNESLRRSTIKVWSCLAHWCKVFAHAEFMPHLVFPFVKQMPKNTLIAFEILATLLLNHFQLWFEFHPMPPPNYLAMCENLLQRYDPELCKFFAAQKLESKDYAWSMLSNAFAEVLDEEQWLMLWDNVLTEAPYFLIFVTVAYNMLSREVLMRLDSRPSLLAFFHDQNPIDVNLLVRKARKLMNRCDCDQSPERFIKSFTPLPLNIYPKFLNYPNEWINKQEQQSLGLQKQQTDIDMRIRNLEQEELLMVERLQNGLKQEEHTRRVKEMEKLYQDTLQREEERLECQRKVLLLYQKEVRQRKSEVIEQLQECEQRRKTLEMEKDIDLLMHNIERERRSHNQEMLLAEDEIRNQEIELLAQRYCAQTQGAPLAQKYLNNIKKLCREREELKEQMRELTFEQRCEPPQTERISAPLIHIEQSLLEIQREFSDIISNGE